MKLYPKLRLTVKYAQFYTDCPPKNRLNLYSPRNLVSTTSTLCPAVKLQSLHQIFDSNLVSSNFIFNPCLIDHPKPDQNVYYLQTIYGRTIYVL